MKIKIKKRQEIEAEQARAQAAKAKREAMKSKVKTWQQLSGKDKDDLLREVVEQVLGVERSSQ